MSLAEHRKAIDERIVKLLNNRTRQVLVIGEIKLETLAHALGEVSQRGRALKVLGSYPNTVSRCP